MLLYRIVFVFLLPYRVYPPSRPRGYSLRYDRSSLETVRVKHDIRMRDVNWMLLLAVHKQYIYYALNAFIASLKYVAYVLMNTL